MPLYMIVEHFKNNDRAPSIQVAIFNPSAHHR